MKNTEGIIFSVSTGGSFLLTEAYSDFSKSVNEFNNLPGPNFGIEFSKYITGNFELGINLSLSWLRGENDSPDFSVIGNLPWMMDPITEPVKYNNRLFGPKLLMHYYITNFNKKSTGYPIQLFLTAGAGLLYYQSEFFYKNRENNELIFGKMTGRFKDYTMTNAVYTVGTGLYYKLSQKVKIKIGFNLNAVNYDFLDVVHNFDTDGNRANIIGIFSDLTVGISVQLTKSVVPFMRKIKRTSSAPNLPFYRKR